MGTVTEQEDSEEIWRNKKASHKPDILSQTKLARRSYQCQCWPRTVPTTCGRISSSRTDVCVVEGKFLPTTTQNFTTLWNNIFARFLTYHLQTWWVFFFNFKALFPAMSTDIRTNTHPLWPPQLQPYPLTSFYQILHFLLKWEKKYIVNYDYPTGANPVAINHQESCFLRLIAFCILCPQGRGGLQGTPRFLPFRTGEPGF